MTAADLELSHSVELELSVNGKKTTLLTAVEKVINQTVLLTPIEMNGKLVGFPPTYKVNFLYLADDQVYCWKDLVVKAIRFEGKVYHCVTLIADAITLNRRGAYRVYIGERMSIAAFTSAGPKLHHVLVKDVSETGFAFLSKESFDVGRTVRLNLRLGNIPEIRLAGQIIRRQEPENGGNDIIYGCKLTERNKMLTNSLMRIQQERRRQQLGL